MEKITRREKSSVVWPMCMTDYGGIVSGTKTEPTEGGDRRSNFLARRDRVLATIVRRPRKSCCCSVEATESV